MWRSSLLLMAIYWLLGLLGALAIWSWVATPLPLRPVAEQLQRVRATGLVYGDQRLSQVVEVPRDGITAIQFWLLAHQRTGGGSVVLHVATPDQPDNDLALVSIPLADIPERPPVTFTLPTFTSAATPVLLFTLEAPDLDRVHALSVLGGDNTYGQGLLLINGNPRPLEDLSFMAFTSDHQGDQYLPLSHVALGRPGLFGQSPFYAAMLWLLLWAYIWVLLLIIRWAWARTRPLRRAV